MRRIALLLATVLLSATLLASGVGVAVAQPHKNQITVTTEPCSNGQTYTFVINAMSKTGHIISPTDEGNNIVIKKGTATFFPVGDTGGTPIGSQDIGGNGNKNGLKGDLIHCTGQTTTDLVGLGPVTAVFDFDAFLTPRGNQ